MAGAAGADPVREFTSDEAAQLLPVITPFLERLRSLHQALARVNAEIDELTAKLSEGNGYPVEELRAQLETLTDRQLEQVREFEATAREIEEHGCLLKDPEIGLVDFYARRSGALVFLCWQLGEPAIQYWHTLDGGFASRRPV
ncbi:MAG TPA: DUF2203 domain-containing protein [bacterium]